MHLHREGKIVGYVEQHHGHYLLENNISTLSSSLLPHGEQPAMLATATSAEWGVVVEENQVSKGQRL